MKKLCAALAAGVALAAPCAALAMDSETLLSHPLQYRVIYADREKAVYADMDTVRAMQTRDYPGSIENISFTMYVETYAKKPDAMAFQKKEIVTSIQQYDATAYGNKEKDQYRLEKTLAAVYDQNGGQIGDASWKGKKAKVEADDIYYSLFRAVHAPKAE